MKKYLMDLGPGETAIVSNGGGNAGPIETLFARLAEEPLDPTFEEYGNFTYLDAESINGGLLHPEGTTSYFGNFFNYSHVFNLCSRDPVLVERLNAAIRANQATPAYIAAKAAIAERAIAQKAFREKQERERMAERKRQARAVLGEEATP